MKYQVQKMLKNSYWDVLHLVKKRRAKRDTYLLLSKKNGFFHGNFTNSTLPFFRGEFISLLGGEGTKQNKILKIEIRVLWHEVKKSSV